VTNRLYLIREGINDAYSEVFQTKWGRVEFPLLTDTITQSMPDRWGLKNTALTRLYARAYACAEFASDLNFYRKDVLV